MSRPLQQLIIGTWALGLCTVAWAMPGMDHSGHDMSGHTMSGMDHTTHEQAPSQATSSPVPPLTDADRAAVYQNPAGHHVHDNALNSYLLVDRLEWQHAGDGHALAWELEGWIGGDTDRLWLRSKGERSEGQTEHAEVQALWGHAITPWWDVMLGARQDFKPGAPQTWAAFGVQGTPWSGVETQATAYLGEAGLSALRLEADYELLLTQQWVLQPSAELNLYGQNDPQRGIGAGLADSELGLRLRYEVTPQFAPYVGVSWKRQYGNTADLSDDPDQTQWLVGVRMWF